LIILIIMSIGTWYIGIVKYIEQARLFKDWREAEAKFWAAKSMTDGMAQLRQDSAFRFMAEEGSIAVKDHSTMPRQQIPLADWLVRRNRVAMEEVRRFGSGLQMTLLGGGHTVHKAAA